MSENINQAVMVLQSAKQVVSELLAENPMLQIRSNSVLDSLISGLSFSVKGNVSVSKPAGTFSPKPLREVFGRSIENKKVRLTKKVRPQATGDDIEDLRKRIDEAYNTFVERDSKELLQALTSLEIRGIAKRAGMEVTMDNPETIDVHFIELIKTAIAEKTALDAEMADSKSFLQSESGQAKTDSKKSTVKK